MFHNRKNVDHNSNPSQNRGRNIKLKVRSILETNTMMEQTWVVAKTLSHKTSSSLFDQDHMSNDQVYKRREKKTR
jgi:hypothetical protein